MGSALFPAISARIENELTRARVNVRCLPWVLISVAGLVIALSFIFACWQYFTALQYRYEAQRWEEQRRELAAQHERLILERAGKQSAKSLVTAAQRLGLMPPALVSKSVLEKKAALAAKQRAAAPTQARAAAPRPSIQNVRGDTLND